MYSQLYKDMMSGTKPGNQGRLVQLHQQTNPFDRYKK